MNLLLKIRQFMYGRYGADDLYHFLFKLYIFIFIIDLFIKNRILSFIELFIVVIMFYRFFSKQIYKRSNENRLFLKIKRKLVKPYREMIIKIKKKINNILDKSYIYKKCSSCGTILRLPIPSNYGIKYVKCPKCKKRLRVIIYKKEKIEVIKNKKERRK